MAIYSWILVLFTFTDLFKMGIFWSVLGYISDPGKTDDPDPSSGLTSRDKHLITKSWELVMKDATGNGIKLFLRLVIYSNYFIDCNFYLQQNWCIVIFHCHDSLDKFYNSEKFSA